MKFNFLQKIILLLIVSIGLLSCKKTFDINSDPTTLSSKNITVPLLFPSGTMFAAAAVGGELQLIGSIWVQNYTQWQSSSQYRTLDQYSMTSSSTYTTRSWSFLYAGAIPDLDQTIIMSEKQQLWNYWFSATLMKAYIYQILTDTYGNIPFTEADKGANNLTPKLDDSKTVIYPGIITLIDEALAKVADATTAERNNPMGKADIVFGGDMTLWTQFANSLKLKVLMRDFTANQTAIQALLAAGNLLSDDAKVAIFTNSPNVSNPLFENDNRQSNTNQNLRGSATLVNYLNHFGDPRVKDFVWPDADGNYTGMPQGTYATYAGISSRALLAATDPVYFISLAETEFMVAECYARLGDLANAKTAYDNAVTAAFSRWGLDATSFITGGGAYEFTATTTTDALLSILTQKWIAAVRCQAWNAFIDINRTGIPALGTVQVEAGGYVWGELVPSPASVLNPGQYPKRMLYPKTSSDYNPNAKDALLNKLTTPLWWQKQ